jgi:pimeloyl-ACP methyl ester carboxylesterase
MPLIDIGGRRLYLQPAGSGSPTVVLDAALSGTSLSWTHVQPAVAAFTRVCAYDRGGFGRSDRAPLPRTAGRLADELHALLTHAGESPPFIVVGHSFGGLVARIFAARHPEITAGLVLVDPAHPEDWVSPAPKEQARIDRGVRLTRRALFTCRIGLAPVISALVGAGALDAARSVVDVVTRGDLRGEMDWLLAPLWKLPPEARRELRRYWTRARFFEALNSQIASISASAAETLAAGAGGYGGMPLVTISSTNPDDHRVRRQEALAALSTAGRHVVASDSGHWIPLDQPEVVVAEVRQMVAKTRAGRFLRDT